MSTTWKIVIPVGLVVLVAAATLWLRAPSSPPSTPTPPAADTTEQSSEPVSAATSQAADDGSADAIVAELLQIAAAEQISFNEETGDASLISSDSAELNALLTTYDQSQY